MAQETDLENTDIKESSENTTSMRASINDGMSHAVMMGCGETYFNVFSIFLKATTLQVGLISTVLIINNGPQARQYPLLMKSSLPCGGCGPGC